MIKSSLLSLLALVCAIAPGCTSIGPIETSGDPAALPPFRTFRVHEEQFLFATEISEAQRAEIASRLRQAAVGALNDRGYREATDVDVLVTLAAVSRPVLSDERGAEGGALHHVDTSVFDAGHVAAPEVPLSPVVGREGDLILELLDPKTRRVVWRASATGAATTPSEALRMARATYTAMVAKLPKAPP